MANTFLLHLLSAWTQNHDRLRELHFLSPQDRGGLRSLQKQKQSKKKKIITKTQTEQLETGMRLSVTGA